MMQVSFGRSEAGSCDAAVARPRRTLVLSEGAVQIAVEVVADLTG